jgi:hypothetical protein
MEVNLEGLAAISSWLCSPKPLFKGSYILYVPKVFWLKFKHAHNLTRAGQVILKFLPPFTILLPDFATKSVERSYVKEKNTSPFYPWRQIYSG